MEGRQWRTEGVRWNGVCCAAAAGVAVEVLI